MCFKWYNFLREFTTYYDLFFKGGEIQCMHTYNPRGFAGALPVKIALQCYAKNQLMGGGYNFVSTRVEVNQPPTRSGYAVVGLSSSSGSWDAVEEIMGES